MTINQMNVTELGLLNINRKIIDSRKYKDNLISTVGTASVVDGTASGFSSDSYLYKNNLSFAEGTLSVTFKGVFTPGNNPQAAWKLQGTTNSLTLQLTNSNIQVIFNTVTILSMPLPQITDTLEIRINTNISSNECDVTAFLNDHIYQKTADLEENPISIQDFSTVFLGNNPTNTETFWKGSITLQNFSILNNQTLSYSPSTGYPITFTKILISDGEFPLSQDTEVIPDHIYKYSIEEINRSGNTILFTSQIGEDANIVIKEIGLYAETDEGEILFSNVSGLNITTGEGIPYDLVFTVNVTLSFVNVIGFPDVGSIISKDPEYCTFKDFKTVKDLTLYILTNLERLIVLNATNIGYRKAQVFYRLQREMERQENCFASIQTFTKLMKRFFRVVKLIFDESAVEIVGDQDPVTKKYITPSVSEDGEVTDFSTSDYVKSIIPFDNEHEWELTTSFSVNKGGSGTVATLSNNTEVQPLVESVSPSLTSWTAHEPATLNSSQATYGNGKFLILDRTGKYVLLSEDAETWTTIERSSYQADEQIVYGNNKYLIVSPSGYVSTSEDGVTWTPSTQNVNLNLHTWNILIFQDNQFITLSADGYVSTSRDGIIWTTPQATTLKGTGHTWVVGTFGNGRFVVIASDTFMSTSLDLMEWSEPVQIEEYFGTLSPYNTLAYHENKFILTSAMGLYCSDNGKTWQKKLHTETRGLTFGNNKYITVYHNNPINAVCISTDLIEWGRYSIELSPPTDSLFTYGKNKFVSILTASNKVYISNDGVTWTVTGIQGIGVSYYWNSLAYGNNRFVAFQEGPDSVYVSTSTDGFIWSERPSLIPALSSSHDWNIIVYDGTKFLAISYNYISTSLDGVNWDAPVPNSTLPSKNWRYSVYDGTKIVLIDGSGYVATSFDGETWESTQPSALNSYACYGLTYDGSRLISLLFKNTKFYVTTSTDYTTWTTPVLSEDIKSPTISYGNGLILCFGKNSNNKTQSLTSNSTLNLKIAKTNTITATILSEDIEYTQNSAMDIPNKYYTTLERPNITESNLVTDFSEGTVRVPLATTPVNSTYEEILYFTTPEQLKGEWEYPIQTSETSGFDLSLVNGTADGYVTLKTTAKNMADEWTTVTSNLGLHIWRDLTYGNGKFVAISHTGYISTSADGETWTTVTYNSDLGSHIWHGITYGNGKFVALGGSGYTSTSANGTTWTAAALNTNLGNRSWRGLTYGNRKFVAIDSGGYISTSTDGETWTTATQSVNLGATRSWQSITYGNGIFVALGENGYVSTSTDGETWTTATYNSNLGNEIWCGITYGNGKFVAIDSYGYISTSTDGETWTTATYNSNLGSNSWVGLTYGNGKFVAIGQAGYASTTSMSLTVTTSYTNALQTSTPYYLKISYSKNENAQYNLSYSYSLNGENFTDLGNYAIDTYGTPEVTSFSLNGPPTYSIDLNKLSLTVDGNSLIQKTENLQGWSTEEEVAAYRMHTARGNIVENPVIVPSENDAQIAFIHKDINTNTWELPLRIETSNLPEDTYTKIAYGNGIFLAIGINGSIARSTNGMDWTTHSSTGIPTSSLNEWISLAYGNGIFVALGRFFIDGEKYYTLTSIDNGATWDNFTQIESSYLHRPQSITYDSANNKFVLLHWDGDVRIGTPPDTLGDPITWGNKLRTNLYSTSSEGWTHIAYGNEMFVAVQTQGNVSSHSIGTSTNGTSWTTTQMPSNIDGYIWRDLIFFTSIFILWSLGGAWSTSSNGTTWSNPSQQTALTTKTWWDTQLAGGQGFLVSLLNYQENNLAPVESYASAYANFYKLWTTPEHTEGLNLDDIDAWLTDVSYIGGSNKIFAALQSDGTFSISRDGSFWEKQNKVPLSGDDTWTSLDNTLLVGAALSSKGKVGLAYDFPSLNSDYGVRFNTPYEVRGSMTYDGRQFIVLTKDGYISTSKDGFTWSSSYLASTGNGWASITYGNGTYLIMSEDGVIRYSTDLINWSQTASTLQGGVWKAMTFGKGMFVAITSSSFATSTNGMDWTITSGVNTRGEFITFNGTYFVAFSTDGYVSYGTVSNNTITWSSAQRSTQLYNLTTNASPANRISGAAFDGEHYLIMLRTGGETYYCSNLLSNIVNSTWAKVLGSSSSAIANESFYLFCYGNDRIVEGYSHRRSSSHYNATLYVINYLPTLRAPQSTNLSSSKEWTAIAGITVSSNDKYVAITRDGYTAVSSSDTYQSWTQSSSSTLGDHDWISATSTGSKIVALGRNGYTSVSTDGTTWSTPAEREGLGSNSWRSITYDGARFIALGYRGWYSLSVDGITWTEAEKSSTLEPSSDAEAWAAIAYGNGKILALSDEMDYSIMLKNTTWKEPEPINAQYLIGSSTQTANAAPFTLSITNSKLMLTPTIDKLSAWSTLEGSLSKIVYTTNPFPSTNDAVLSDKKEVIGKVVSARLSGMAQLYLNENGFIRTFYRDTSHDMDNSSSLKSTNPLKSNTPYDINVSFNGTRYTLYYKLDNMGDTSVYPDSETINYYSALPISWNKNSTITFGCNENNHKFTGSIDFSKIFLQTDNYRWTALSQLNQIYTKTLVSGSNNTVYDVSSYSIDDIPITTNFGLILDADTFTVEPDKKYYTKVTYTPSTGTYTVYKSEDGEAYTEAFSNTSEYAMSPVNSVYLGVEPNFNPTTAETTITNPFDGTIYLKDLKAVALGSEWAPVTTEGTSEPQIIQYYNIPKYDRNRYTLSDLCNPENTLTVLDTSFTGNTDLIDFSSPIGFTLCVKTFLEDSNDKLLLAKVDPTGGTYFTLSFVDQTVKFVLKTQTQDIILSKELKIEELATFESAPILLSVIVENNNSIYTFSFYRNNELIDQVITGVDGFLDASISYLANYTNTPSEAKLYTQDIIVVDGAITKDDLYYITNLTDTNF